MDEQLKGLKKAMNLHSFRHVQFNDQQRQIINEKIEQLKEEEITQVILTLLTQSKTGSELAQLLHVRGIKSINNNEGIIYTVLHSEELRGTVESYWSEEGEKYYILSSKGLKILQKEQKLKKGRLSLKELFSEVTQYES